MILKNSEEYDSILHVGADLDFIDRFFTANIKDLDTAKIQLLAFYAKEYESNIQHSLTSREKSLASVLNNRNSALIEREYSSFKVRQIENNGENQLSMSEALDRADMNCLFAESDLKTEEISISLLRVASFTDSPVIWGKERDISTYSQELERKTFKSEDGTIQRIEECKSNLLLAQIQLNDMYRYAKEQKMSDGPDTTDGEIKR